MKPGQEAQERFNFHSKLAAPFAGLVELLNKINQFVVIILNFFSHDVLMKYIIISKIYYIDKSQLM